MSQAAELSLSNVLRTFGGIRAVDNVSFRVTPGETLGVIGPNGAGKSVLLNVINGVYRAESGRIELDGRRIDQLRPHQITGLGVGRSFQIDRAIPRLPSGRVRNARPGCRTSAGRC